MTTPAAAITDIDVIRVAGNIGAEIRGVDAAVPVMDERIAAVRQALLDHKVIFLRDQSMTYETQVAFALRFGHPTLGHPIFGSPDGQPFREEMDSSKGMRANHWHTDLTFVDRPPAFTMLYSVVRPPVGGDTIFANMASAYQSMPPELQDLANRLRIIHCNDSDYTSIYQEEARTNPSVAALREAILSTVFQAEHPAVRVHPETRERALLVGGFAVEVKGFTRQASRDIIRILQEYATRPEHCVRWNWRAGDLVIWDNRATQHYAVFDYGTAHRRGERITIAGTTPVGVDGQSSLTLRGDATAYYADAPDTV